MREPSDIHPKWVAYFFAGLAALGLFVFIGNWLLFRVLYRTSEQRKYVRSLVQSESPLPPEPRLQLSPEADNREYLQHEREVLNEYGWVDPQKEVARIPIDRAMDLLIERGVK